MHLVFEQKPTCDGAFFNVLRMAPTCCAILLRNTLTCCRHTFDFQRVALNLIPTQWFARCRNTATLLFFKSYKLCMYAHTHTRIGVSNESRLKCCAPAVGSAL